MQQRNEAGGNFVEKEYSVPDEMVGLIIGRGGEQIMRLRTETGCTINMFPRSNGDPNRRCTLTGSRESVEAAKSMIEQIIIQSGHYTTEMMIPGPEMGRLIGKGGENLKNLQEKCGVKMVVIQANPEPTIHPKPLRISGDQENVEFAEKVVANFLAQIDTEGSQRFFVSRPVYRGVIPDLRSCSRDLLFHQEQGDGSFFLRIIRVLIIGTLIMLVLELLTSRI